MTDSTKEAISKNTPITIQVGIFFSIIGGAFYIGSGLQKLENRLAGLERQTISRWSFHMENDAWSEFKAKNPGLEIPSVKAIRERYSAVFVF